ncbi:carboxypeptidase regulatory-like domain-containing protein [Mumia zhuanghuii]|uniref:Alpha-amylase n=2 Tax=Mumia TaxID=1546255 RepID=A0ABW1QLN1_9ACTN|nr:MULTISPECIES: carboxypeptidase regulatory-like domain-containing protein [Mumia]KAA1418398.1 carboxypeptidase regulatory-like domain-containing protein [Mumia zhuanghuii]
MSGRVLLQPVGGAATPAAGITIEVSTVNAPYDVVAEVDTEADGSFTVPGLADNTYLVRASDAVAPYADEYYGNAWKPISGTRTRLRGQDATLDDIVLEPAGFVRGVVEDERGSPVPATISITEMDGEVVGHTEHFQTEPDGSFDTREAGLSDLVAGGYRIQASAGKNADGYPYDWPTAAVNVAPGQESVADLQVSVLSTVDFTVIGPDGTPLPHALVIVYDFVGGRWSEGHAGRTAADATGHFRSASRTGKFKYLFAVPEAGYSGPPAVAEYWQDAYTLAEATPIDLGGPESHREFTVQLGPAPRITAGTPTISGAARTGSTLRASLGRWAPTALHFRYQWRANGTAIPGATSSALRLTNAHAGKRISVQVTATKKGHVTATRTSATTSPSIGVLTARVPKISGKAAQGKKLRAHTRSWGPGKVTLRFRWYRNGKPIPHATHKTYRLTKKDVGKRIRVKVTGKRGSYATSSRSSRKTAKVRR